MASISTPGSVGTKNSKFKPSVASSSHADSSRRPVLSAFATPGFQESARNSLKHNAKPKVIEVSSDSAPSTPGLKRDSSEISILDDFDPHFTKRPRRSSASEDKENILQPSARINSNARHQKQSASSSSPPAAKPAFDPKSDLLTMGSEQLNSLHLYALAEQSRIQAEIIEHLREVKKTRDNHLLNVLFAIVTERLNAIVEQKTLRESKPTNFNGRPLNARVHQPLPDREPSLVILEGPVPTPPKPTTFPSSRAPPPFPLNLVGGSRPLSQSRQQAEPATRDNDQDVPMLPTPAATVVPQSSTSSNTLINSQPPSSSQNRPLLAEPTLPSFPSISREPTPPAPRPSPAGLVLAPSEAALWETMEDLPIDDVDMDETTPIASSSSSPPAPPPSSNPGDIKSRPFYPEVAQKLRHIFKLPSFRSNQLEAITATLDGRDAFVLMPTGGGKSLCYQLPAVCSGGRTSGITIVISPLIALMKDQVQSLQDKNIRALLSCENSHFSEDLLLSADKRPSLWYLTPEKLQANGNVHKILRKLYERGLLARFVADEAHCISTWGQDFREAYTYLGCLRERYPNVPIMALTATANQRTRLDIVEQLKLDSTYAFFQQSFNRPNLHYSVERKKRNYIKDIADLIASKYRHMSGVIYCHSRASCEKVAQGLRDKGIKASHFHAGMASAEKEEAARAWRADEVPVIVATIAFGMGIDKPDVRFVIHYDMPSTMSGYYQETGRAGRDGRDADCIMYFSYADLNSHLKQINSNQDQSEESKQRQREAVREVYQFCDNLSHCRRVQVLKYFDETFSKEDCNEGCDNCMAARQVVPTDVSEEAKALCSLIATITQQRREKVSKTQLTAILLGSNIQDVRNKNHDSLKEFGTAKGMDRGLVEIMFNALEFQEVITTIQEPNSSGYHNDYIALGPSATSFVTKTQKFMVDWLPKAPKGKSSKKAKPMSVSAPVRSKSNRKPPVEEDPIADFEDTVDMDDDQPPLFVQGSSTRTMPPRSNSAPTAAGRAPSVPPSASTYQAQDEIDPSTQLYNKLVALCEKLQKVNGFDSPDDVLDNEVLQYISVCCPCDYKSFRDKMIVGFDPETPNKEELAELKYKQFGPKFLRVCIDHKAELCSKSTPTPQAMPTPADLRSRYEFTPIIHSPAVPKPPSSAGPRPKFKPS